MVLVGRMWTYLGVTIQLPEALGGQDGGRTELEGSVLGRNARALSWPWAP